jgi:hypothetical protein
MPRGLARPQHRHREAVCAGLEKSRGRHARKMQIGRRGVGLASSEYKLGHCRVDLDERLARFHTCTGICAHAGYQTVDA